MDDRAPISLCMIVKNESGQLDSCLKSIRPFVAEIVIVDTGSTDNTQEIAKKYADKFEVFTGCNDDQGRIIDFALARQRSFDLATNEWVMWIDGDDEVHNAHLIPQLIDVNKSERTLIMLPYEYSRDHKGNVTCFHWRERIFFPKTAFKWQGPIHEVVTPIDQGVVMHRNNDIRIIHKREESGKVIESGRNLRILKSWYEKNGESDVRQLYYLGLEYGNNGDVDNALKFHKRYIELSGWDEEKFMSCMKVTDHYQALGKYEEAVLWALKALTIREGWAEPYFSLSRSYYFFAQAGGSQEQRNWEKCIHFAELGLKIPPTETILFVNPMERNYDIHRYLNIAYNKVGKVDQALASAKLGLKANPDDNNLKCNIAIYEEHMHEVAFNEASQILFRTKDKNWFLEKANELFKQTEELSPITNVEQAAEPQVIKFNEKLQSLKNGLDIVFFVGFSAEHWNPDSINTKGIGGSETAVWEMSRRLVELGHKVRVFGDCPEMEGVFEGVEFIHYDKFKNIETDVFISSRRVHTVDDVYGLKSRVNLCWVHDVHCGDSLNHARSIKFDKFLTLSNWHRDFFLNQYDFIHPSQVIVTRNGIDLNRFANYSKIKKNPYKAIYSSSPDRGLQAALDSWHLVREQVPEAELHIYYGFESWKSSAIINGATDHLKLIDHLECLIRGKQHLGVVYHGRINQTQLANEFISAGVWAYPTWFSETSCITAMEAQAAGLHIVTSPIAALKETVGNRGVMIEGDWLSPEYQHAWASAVIGAMKDEFLEYRQQNRQYAIDNFGMDSLAVNWSKLLNELILEVEANIVVPYKSAI